MAHASTSRLARSPTPDLHDTSDDVLPLAFDSEAELLGVLGRLRDGLQQRTRKAWEDDGRKGSCAAVEEIVLKVSPRSCCFWAAGVGRARRDSVRWDGMHGSA